MFGHHADTVALVQAANEIILGPGEFEALALDVQDFSPDEARAARCFCKTRNGAPHLCVGAVHRPRDLEHGRPRRMAGEVA